AQRVAEALSIPVIGIGAGPGVDGQVLVSHDLLGLTKDFQPRFLRRYAELYEAVHAAVAHYVDDVKRGHFPSEKESY
ncbi:MAG: 3-methyl-2-oxobutanoate hydroxymethyltransferase, partial [Catalinimonas sp.]